jgi:hypothetical protein
MIMDYLRSEKKKRLAHLPNLRCHRPGSFPSFEPLTRRTLTVTSAETNLQVTLDVCLGVAPGADDWISFTHGLWMFMANKDYSIIGFMGFPDFLG